MAVWAVNVSLTNLFGRWLIFNTEVHFTEVPLAQTNMYKNTVKKIISVKITEISNRTIKCRNAYTFCYTVSLITLTNRNVMW